AKRSESRCRGNPKYAWCVTSPSAEVSTFTHGVARPRYAARRFPPPWSVEEYNDACFIVRDNDGQQLAYVYFENEPGRRSAANMLTREEARRIAVNLRPPESL